MNFKKILFIGVFVLAISSAFATKVAGPYDGYSYEYSFVCYEGVLAQIEANCRPYNTGAQCTVWGYGDYGVEEFPAYYYGGNFPYCTVPTYNLW